MTPTLLRRVPTCVLCVVYNLFFGLGHLPKTLLDSRTVFLPKSSSDSSPGNFRPISIASVMLRQMNKILAARLVDSLPFDERQKGFLKKSGTSESALLLDSVIRQQKTRVDPLFVVLVDLAKAFDSVSHQAIKAACRHFRIPRIMGRFLSYIYDNAETCLQGPGFNTPGIHPLKGVRQGDPLSPLLFIMVIDIILRRLPSETGTEHFTSRLNALAYADDLVLLTSTKRGMEQTILSLLASLEEVSMRINTGKCLAFCLDRGRGEEAVKVTDPQISIGGTRVRSIGVSEHFTYMGVVFSPRGMSTVTSAQHADAALQTEGAALNHHSDKLLKYLRALDSSRLKPFQRVYAVKNHVIPRIQYDLTLRKANCGFLNKLDGHLRRFLRRWVHFPPGTTNAIFHSATGDGGLGIQSLRWFIPRLRLKMLEKLEVNEIRTIHARELTRLRSTLRDPFRKRVLDSCGSLRQYWRSRLYVSVDGKGLRGACKVPTAHRWLNRCFGSGRDYVEAVKLRFNQLPTKSRTARGRPLRDTMCRAGCLVKESLNHVVQQCSRAHGVRIKRHNRICDLTTYLLRQRGYEVQREVRFQTDAGFRVPDILAYRPTDRKAFIIDCQVVSDVPELDVLNRAKAEKYSNLSESVAERFGTPGATCLAVTLSWRGVWSFQSMKGLTDYGLIGYRQLSMFSERVVEGSVHCWHSFNKMTSRR
jgi:Reverse transcriptase (RNA-dependent DNA polymerase)